MDLESIYALMERFERSSLTGLELEQNGTQDEGEYIKAPLVGTFYAAAGPDAEPFVKVGDQVKKGQTVCILEAMKMMSEIPAPMDCVIEEILVENGSLAGYDAPLFRVRRV